MDHKLSLNIAMRPDLKMTPQLQQAIKLLQLSRPELLETVQTELMENPVLDMNEVSATPNAESAGDEGPQNAPETRELSVSDQQPAPQKDTMPELPAATPEGGDSDAPDAANEAHWENYIEHYNAYSYSPGSGGMRFGDDDMPTLFRPRPDDVDKLQCEHNADAHVGCPQAQLQGRQAFQGDCHLFLGQ